MTAYLIGSVSAGVAVGGALGGIGRALVSREAASGAGLLLALSVAIGIGIAFDAGLTGRPVPSVRRQVDDRWMGAYRGWVYGLGFGLQLGAGMVTIVTVSAVYAAFLSAFLSDSAAAGALIGGAFGLIRWSTILAVAGVRTSGRVLAVDRRLARWDAPARRLAIWAEAAVLAAALVGVARI